MKHIVLAASAVIGILGTSSCSKGTEAKSAPAPASRSATLALAPPTQDYAMVRAILNASPASVSKILGAADGPIAPSKDCDYLPACSSATYQHGKFEALFYKNRLKWLSVNRPGLMTEDLLARLGFPSARPTFTNPGSLIAWRSAEARGTARGPLVPIKGIRQIVAFPDYALITVAADHDAPL